MGLIQREQQRSIMVMSYILSFNLTELRCQSHQRIPSTGAQAAQRTSFENVQSTSLAAEGGSRRVNSTHKYSNTRMARKHLEQKLLYGSLQLTDVLQEMNCPHLDYIIAFETFNALVKACYGRDLHSYDLQNYEI